MLQSSEKVKGSFEIWEPVHNQFRMKPSKQTFFFRNSISLNGNCATPGGSGKNKNKQTGWVSAISIHIY